METWMIVVGAHIVLIVYLLVTVGWEKYGPKPKKR